MLEDQIDDFQPIEAASFTQDGFDGRIMETGDFANLTLTLDSISGKGTGGFLDVPFCVMTFSKTEEFEEFPGKVLIGFALFALLGVEIDGHGVVHGNSSQEISEVVASIFTEELILSEHCVR